MSFWMRSSDRSTRAVRLVSTAILRMPNRPAPRIKSYRTPQCNTWWYSHTLQLATINKHAGIIPEALLTMLYVKCVAYSVHACSGWCPCMRY